MTENDDLDNYNNIMFVAITIKDYVNCYRFMICCDRCGEWYHGDCVGISVAEGKRMEKSGKEYVCIKCNGQWYMLQACAIHIMSFIILH